MLQSHLRLQYRHLLGMSIFSSPAVSHDASWIVGSLCTGAASGICSLVAAVINFQNNLLKAVSVFSYRCLPLASCWISQAWYLLCFASMVKFYPFGLVFQLHSYLEDSHMQLEDSGEVLHSQPFLFGFSPFIDVSCSLFNNIHVAPKYDRRVQCSNSFLGAKFSEFYRCNNLPLL